jgi:hypothetical protein
MTRLELGIEQIVFARNYTIELLDQTPQAEWFRMPAAGVTHIAWQVGHLACAEYRLALWRIRGAQPQDNTLVSEAQRSLFGYESVPYGDPAQYPSPVNGTVVCFCATNSSPRNRRQPRRS